MNAVNYTLLDEFAKCALTGLMVNVPTDATTNYLAKLAATAYRVAEAMVAEKQRRDTPPTSAVVVDMPEGRGPADG